MTSQVVVPVQQHARIVSQFEGKNHRRQRRTQRTRKYGRHAHQWPQTCAVMRQEASFQTSQRTSHHQQGSQNTA